MATNNGTTVFIAGSRRLSKLSSDVKVRLDRIADKGLTAIIGDANGVDKAVQKYFVDRNYRKVVVFCMEGGCRNNVGRWPTRVIAAPSPKRRDFAHFATKDRAMAEEADFGLMLWDGQSRGTLTNIVDLVRKEKLVVVYVSTDKEFRNLRNSSDLALMLRRVDPVELERVDHDLKFSGKAVTPSGSSARLSLF